MVQMSELLLDYYYGQEAEQFIFYRIPKLLFTDDRFFDLSIEAKVLYGVMLDRMGLSIKNKWLDEKKRVYIVFTIDKMMDLLHCREQKVNKLLKDLEEIGLIERKRNGLGKPNFIYIKNFLGNHKKEDGAKKEKEQQSQQQKNENDNSKNAIFTTQEMPKSQCNNTLCINKTVFNETLSYPSYLSTTDYDAEPKQRVDRIDGIDRISNIDTTEKSKQKYFVDKKRKEQLQQSVTTGSTDKKTMFTIDKDLEKQICKETIQKNIEYGFLAENKTTKYQIPLIDNIIDIMVSVITSNKNTIRINGEEIPQKIVKERFLQLNSGHIEYVLECLNHTTNKIHNIRAYYISVLYNAPETRNAYYHAEFHHEKYA